MVSLSLDSTMAKLVQRCTDHFFDWRDMLRKTAIAILTKVIIPAPRRRLLLISLLTAFHCSPIPSLPYLKF